MSLSEIDRELIETRAELIAAKVAEGIVERVIRTHIETCPHGQGFKLLRAKFIGICIGSGVAAGSAGAGVMALLGKALGL